MPPMFKPEIPDYRKPGVYCVKNSVNGKVYVGSATDSVRRRLMFHVAYLRRSAHGNDHFQNAWNKYGAPSFRFALLEGCSGTLKELLAREQFWMDKLEAYNPEKGYNKCPTAGSMVGRRFSEETKQKMSRDRKGIHPVAATAAAAIANKGKPRSLEVRAAISKKNKGVKRTPEQIEKIKANHWRKRPDTAEIAERGASKIRGRKHTEEHKAKISASGKGKGRPRPGESKLHYTLRYKLQNIVRKVHERLKVQVS